MSEPRPDLTTGLGAAAAAAGFLAAVTGRTKLALFGTAAAARPTYNATIRQEEEEVK